VTFTVTAVPDGTPRPYVEVTVDSVPAPRVTVWRVSGGRRFKVRGLVNVISTDGVTGRDYEAGFFVPVGYQMEYFDASGMSTGYSDTVSVASVGLTGIQPWEAWFHNPLDPSGAVKVDLYGSAAQQLTRGTDATTAFVPGRSVGVTFPGTRRGLQQVVLDCRTHTVEDAQKLDTILGAYDSDALSIVCVCAHPQSWLPPTLFAFVGSSSLQPFGVEYGEVLWGLTGDETAPPTPAVITPLLTYDDFTAFYASYDAFTAAYPDYLTASRDYSVKGAS